MDPIGIKSWTVGVGWSRTRLFSEQVIDHIIMAFRMSADELCSYKIAPVVPSYPTPMITTQCIRCCLVTSLRNVHRIPRIDGTTRLQRSFPKEYKGDALI